MDEYINKRALENKLNTAAAADSDSRRRAWVKAICILHDMPAADVAPVVHGRWENVYGDFSTAECVVCKSQFEVTFGEESNGALWDGFCQSYRYCPNCGARMDGEQK